MGELEVWRAAVDHEFTELRASAEVEFRLADQERDALAARLDKLETVMVQYVRVEVARQEAYEDLAARLDKLERRLAALAKATGDTTQLALSTAKRVTVIETTPITEGG